MPDVTRQALEEWDQEVLGSNEDLSELFEEIPAQLQFKGTNLQAEVIKPAVPYYGHGCHEYMFDEFIETLRLIASIEDMDDPRVRLVFG